MLCKVLDISRSAYYKHKNRVKPEKEKQDELICSLIREYHSTFDEILGYRRMTMFINKLNQTSFSEGYIHRLKKFKSLEELAEKIVNYIEFYNEKRFQKKLGCMAPLEYRNHASKCA